MVQGRDEIRPLGAKREVPPGLSVGKLYLAVVGVLLLGYAILDRGFAYLGVPPVFVSEIVLALGIFVVLTGACSARVFMSPIAWITMIFVLWQLLITLQYIRIYGLDAVRDAATWYYATFAFLLGGILLRSRSVRKFADWYAICLPWFLIIAPILFLITVLWRGSGPTYPFSGRPIIYVKAGDVGVHLAGVAAFLALGLNRLFPRMGNKSFLGKDFILWAFIVVDLIVVGSRNRGGLLAFLTACAIVTFFRPMNRLVKVVIPLLVIVVFVAALDIRIPVGGDRYISVKQVTANIQSIVFRDDSTGLSNTIQWRLDWWAQIIDDTVFGKDFWTGKGYGVNLAKLHGFGDQTGNRSPHNGHMTILARSGVPGFVLWVALNIAVAVSLLRGYFRSRASEWPDLANLNLWVLAYWSAFIVNMSFDVYLEGPQGGIWFWCIVGFAIALTQEQNLWFRSTGSASPSRFAGG